MQLSLRFTDTSRIITDTVCYDISQHTKAVGEVRYDGVNSGEIVLSASESTEVERAARFLENHPLYRNHFKRI